jgi:hypothetical protein
MLLVLVYRRLTPWNVGAFLKMAGNIPTRRVPDDQPDSRVRYALLVAGILAPILAGIVSFFVNDLYGRIHDLEIQNRIIEKDLSKINESVRWLKGRD